jgi:biotin carboxyl carrier protein
MTGTLKSGANPGANPGQADPEKARRARQDREAIVRLADDLLPALIAKLAASGLGEIEVREGGWKARLRKPATADAGRRSGGRVAEALAGHGHAAPRGAAGHGRPDERDLRSRPEAETVEESDRIAARSPAVGIYHPRDMAVGMRVRSGDRIGSVDVLGVQQDVVAPVDGVIGSSLAEAGEAVEYGQELVRIGLPEHLAGETDLLAREPATLAGRP